MAQKYVGLDLGTHSVKAVVVASTLRGLEVIGRYEQPIAIAQGDDRLTASLAAARRLIHDHGLGHRPVGVALPGGSGSFRVLGFPFADAKRIAQAVSFEVDGQFPIPLDELAHDHVVVPTGGKNGRALVVACRNELVDRVSVAMRELGMDLRLVTVGSMAVAQAVAGGVPRAGDAVGEQRPVMLVVDIGDRTTELIALTDKGPAAARTLRKGGRGLTRALRGAYRFVDDVEAEAAKHRDAFLPAPGIVMDALQQEAAETVRRAMLPLAREIEHTRQWLKSEYELIVTEIRLAGGGARLRGLAGWLAQESGLPVVPATPGTALRGGASEEWSGHLAALGAAVGASRHGLIQLQETDASGGGDGVWIYERFSTVAMLGVAVLAFAAVDTIVRVRAAEAERDAYVLELEDESYAVFGEVISDPEAVHGRLAAVEDADLTERIPQRGALEMLHLLSKVAMPPAGASLAAPPAAEDPSQIDVTALGAPGGPGGGSAAPTVITRTTPDGATYVIDSSGASVDPATGAPVSTTGAEGEAAGVEGEASGLLADDALIFSVVDIRSLKIDLKLTAARATAQDRVAAKLETVPCISQVTKGKIRDRNERKEFDMAIDHNCYVADKMEVPR